MAGGKPRKSWARNRKSRTSRRAVRPILELLESYELLSVATTTVLSASTIAPVHGQSDTFTATVASALGTPTGDVTFMDGATALASEPLTNGVATYTTSALTVGEHAISADYTGATGSYSPSASTVTSASLITAVAGKGVTTYNGYPWGVVFDSSGNLYFSDLGNQEVYKLTPSGALSVYAGNGTAGYTGNGGQATSAELGGPQGLAIDASGNLYIADSGNHVIRKVTPGGVISTFAGDGTRGYTGNGGLATAAELNGPAALAFNAAGDLYIADESASVVRMVNTSGDISTVAGTGTAGFSGDAGLATAAELDNPAALAIDPSGNLYIADSTNNRVRFVSALTGDISTVAGDGTAGFSGDAGSATSAELQNPQGLVLDSQGNLFISDTSNNAIREVSPTGIITTVAGDGTAGFSGDGGPAGSASLWNQFGLAFNAAGDLIFADFGNSVVRGIAPGLAVDVALDPTTTVLSASTVAPVHGQSDTFTATVASANGTPTGGVTFMDGATALATVPLTNGVATYTTAALTVGEHAISADYTGATGSYSPSASTVTGAGLITAVAGQGVTTYSGGNPYGVVFDSSGNMYFSDAVHQEVYKLTPAGALSVYAGNGMPGYSGNNGPATSAELYIPAGLAIDASGNLYIADFGNHVIRKVTPGGIISTFAGDGTAGYTGNGGLATAAELNGPANLAFNAAGDLYIADPYANVVRMVNTSGDISTVAGTGTAGFSGDAGLATAAELDNPAALAIDPSGNLYIADSTNNRVRFVSALTGDISTVAGNGTTGYSGDGGLATSAELHGPQGLVLDSQGNLFISDAVNNAIREVSPGGIITTVAGDGTAGFSGDGGPAGSAALNNPNELAFNAAGDLIVADNSNNVVRSIAPGIAVDVAASGPAVGFTVTGGVSETAGGVETVTVTALDQYGNTVTGYSGTVAITSSDAQAVLPASAGLTNGVGSFDVTLKTAGADSITATDTVTSSITGTDSGIVVSPAAASHFTVTGGVNETAGGVETVTVTAVDQYGNTVTGYTGAVAITSSDAQAVLPASSTLTNGVGTFSVTLKTAGSESITATDTVTSSITGTDSGIVVTAAAASHYTVTGGVSETAGGVETVTVTALDQYGNTVTGYAGTVAITSSDGQAVVPASAGLTNGVGTFDVTLKTAGADSITATDTVTSSITGTDSGIVVSPAVATHFTVTGGVNETAGGVEHVTVTALDQYGNTVTNYTGAVYTGAVAITSSDVQAVLPTSSTLTNGVGTFAVTLKTAGTESITATDTVTSSITGTDSGIVVSAASASHYTVTGGVNETAGGVETVTVTALDPYGNVASGYAGAVAITSSDPQAVLPANASLTSGVGTFNVTLKTAGTESITATDAVTSSITGTDSGIIVSAASATRFFVHGYFNDVAGGVETVTVTALDQYGNTVTNYTGAVAITSSDPQAVLPSNATLTNGVGTSNVTLKTAGSESITATDTVTSSITGTDAGIHVSPGSVYGFSVTGGVNEAVGGIETVTVAAVDQYGNNVTEFFDAVAITSSDPQAVLPASASLTNGVGTFDVTLATVGTQSITATDLVTPSLTGTDSGIVVSKSPSQAAALSASLTQSYFGQSVTLTATFQATAVGSDPMTGTVAFFNGTTLLGTVPLGSSSPAVVPGLVQPDGQSPNVSGTAGVTVSLLAVGTHSVTAVYSGNAVYSSDQSTIPLAILVKQTVTSATLTSTTTAQGTILKADVVVTSPGSPLVAGTASFYDGSTFLGSVPIVNGAADLNLGPVAPGNHVFQVVYSGSSQAATSSAPLVLPGGPSVVAVSRYGAPGQQSYVVLNIDGPLNPAAAQSTANYIFTRPIDHGRREQVVHVRRAIYDPSTGRVVLETRRPLRYYGKYQLTVNTGGPNGLSSNIGVPLDGSGAGRTGDFVTTISHHDLVGRDKMLGLPPSMIWVYNPADPDDDGPPGKADPSARLLSPVAVDSLLAAGSLHEVMPRGISHRRVR